MPTLSTLATFGVAAYVLLIIPGPAVTFVIARSVSSGRGVGLASVLGLHTGTLAWVAAAATGLATLLMSSVTAFAVVKYVGGAYLVYLGVRTLIAARRKDRSADADGEAPARLLPAASPWQSYRQGIVVNVTNVKLGMFFLAFLPQFLHPADGSIPAQVVVLGALFVALGVCSDCTYVLAASAVGDRLRRSARLGRYLGYVSGVVYLALAGLAFAASPTRASAST